MRHTLVLLTLATACMSKGNYAQTTAKAACQHMQECDKTSFENAFDKFGDCTDYYSGIADCQAQHCDSFDAKTAQSCVHDIASDECATDSGDSNLLSGCVNAWTDCDAIALAACMASAAL